MAVDKMKLVSIVGSRKDMEEAARIILFNGRIHMLNAISELKSNCLRRAEHEEEKQHERADICEMENIKPYATDKDFSEDEKIIKALHDLLDIKQEVEKEYIDVSFDYHEIMDDLKICYGAVKSTVEKIEGFNEEIAKRHEYISNLHYARNAELDVGALLELRNFEFAMMRMSREKFKKLKLNYENIPAIVIHLGVAEDNDIVAAITPFDRKEEAERIFVSLNVMPLELPKGYKGSAEIIIRTLNEEIHQMKEEIQKLKESVQWRRDEYYDIIRSSYNTLVLEQKLEYIKSEIAVGEHLFYMFGFVPARDIDKLRQDMEESFTDKFILMSDNAESRRFGHSPPTKLVNNALVRPFETLVTMYGIPNYNEKDPTLFFAISYMILFGAMFGDLGQGFVIFLGGLFLSYILKNRTFGGILSRLGISSMFFGLMYGSVFGSEEVIPSLLIRPMENMNTVLISAILFGIVLINIAYIFGLMNFYNRKDIEEGIFGREGLAGFIFFWTLILFVGDSVTKILRLPAAIYIVIMAATLLLMVFKEPLAHKLQGHQKLYEHSASDYYIEAGFGVIETILSVASNVISFIRVGAFALNHVGLYIAFATLAQMVRLHAAGIVILIIGNIIIIGLEGLIVFIQSLRLEFYELFSKYFSGYGVPYTPARMTNNNE